MAENYLMLFRMVFVDAWDQIGTETGRWGGEEKKYGKLQKKYSLNCIFGVYLFVAFFCLLILVTT